MGIKWADLVFDYNDYQENSHKFYLLYFEIQNLLDIIPEIKDRGADIVNELFIIENDTLRFSNKNSNQLRKIFLEILQRNDQFKFIIFFTFCIWQIINKRPVILTNIQYDDILFNNEKVLNIPLPKEFIEFTNYLQKKNIDFIKFLENRSFIFEELENDGDFKSKLFDALYKISSGHSDILLVKDTIFYDNYIKILKKRNEYKPYFRYLELNKIEEEDFLSWQEIELFKGVYSSRDINNSDSFIQFVDEYFKLQIKNSIICVKNNSIDKKFEKNLFYMFLLASISMVDDSIWIWRYFNKLKDSFSNSAGRFVKKK